LKNFKRLVGQKIKLRRLELGINSQGKLADMLGIDTARVSNYERGVHLPEGEIKSNLLHALKADESLFDIPETLATPPQTVGNMTPTELEELVARASKRDGTLNFEIAKLTKRNQELEEKFTLLPENFWEAWAAASSHFRALALYFLTGSEQELKKVSRSLWSEVETLRKVLSVPPHGPSRKGT
jgi:transcriptional regulator with XRE-family HTH domain